MAKPRKTKAQRDREFREAVRQAWEEFLPKLKAVQDLAAAQLLVANAPPVDSPGRRYYSNLGWFIQNFSPPHGANHTELRLYLQLAERMSTAGAFKPGAWQKVEADLRLAMATEKPWS